MILETTAKAYEGLCAPCSKGGGICEICGTRMSQPNMSGKFICRDCEKSRRMEAIPTLPKNWNKLGDVDWWVVANNYALAIDSQLQQFLVVQNHDPAYGVLFQLAQNWMLDVHINTQNGIKEIPEKMRTIANWGRELSDEEWIAKMGVWYTPAWKYGDIGSIFKNESARTISEFHYDFFEMLYGSAEDDEGSEEIAKRIDEARLSAIELVRDSETFRRIDRTQDFAVYVVDDEGLDYATRTHLPH